MIKLNVHFSIHLDKKDGWLGKLFKHRPPLISGRLLSEACDQMIDQLSASRSKSTIDNYRTALRSVLCYAGQDVCVEQLNSAFMEGYQRWLQQQGVTLNTISCYMRSLRSLLNNADIAIAGEKVFDKVYTGKATTEKRSLSELDLEKLYCLPLAKDSPLYFARDLFLFCTCALGMPFVDAAFLRKSQIRNGYITYLRHKTGQRICIKMEAPMQKIMERHIGQGEYVFPILRKGTMEEYHNARSRYNRQLRQLGDLAGLSRSLTSYTARHSWATMAYRYNIDLPVISKALGHTSSNMTLTYIREVDDMRIDEANHFLVSKVLKDS